MAILSPTLTVVDNADGTATFTVSGGTAGVTNTIKLTTLQQPLGWASLGTITGNASGVFSVNPGAYWCCAFAQSGSDQNVSLPMDAIFTSSDTAILELILQSVVSKLQGAADLGQFGDMDNTRIQRMDVVILDRLKCGLPCIIVTPGTQESESQDTTNQSSDIIYPVNVAIYDAKASSEEGRTPEYFLWRERIRQLFHEKHLPGIARSVKGVVQPQFILDHKDSAEDMYGFASTLQFLFTVRELIWA